MYQHWNSAGANGSGSVLSGEDVELDATQMRYVTSYSAAELRASHCERVCKMLLSRPDLSGLIGVLYKMKANQIDLLSRRRMAEVRVLDA